MAKKKMKAVAAILKPAAKEKAPVKEAKKETPKKSVKSLHDKFMSVKGFEAALKAIKADVKFKEMVLGAEDGTTPEEFLEAFKKVHEFEHMRLFRTHDMTRVLKAIKKED